MKRLTRGLTAAGIALLLAAPLALARDLQSLDTLLARAAPKAALDYHAKSAVPRQRVALSRLTARRTLPRFRLGEPPEDAWAALLAPQNRCTDLVRKVCGPAQECGEAATCPTALQILDLYNGQPDAEAAYEFEATCIIALEDHIIFPACAP